MSSVPAERIDVLARRVRWLDRYRRALSIVGAVVCWFLLSRELSAIFESEWPGVISLAVSLLFATAAWWLVEVAFAWMIALWETEHDVLSRDRGLPRAELLRK